MHEQTSCLDGECNQCDVMEYSGKKKVVSVRAYLLLQWQLYFPLSVMVSGFQQHPV